MLREHAFGNHQLSAAPSISVIIPTVSGREELLAACIEAYKATTPGVQIIVVRNQKACGIAWQKGAKRAKGDYLHFTADDLVPMPGWWEPAVEAADRGDLPGANVLTVQNYDGAWAPESSMHAGAYLMGDVEVQNLLVPFFSRDLFDRGDEFVHGRDWLLPIHYGSDDWVTFLSDRLQIQIAYLQDYCFGHHNSPEGRLHNSRPTDIPLLCEAMSVWGRVPTAYAQMGAVHGWYGPSQIPMAHAPDRQSNTVVVIHHSPDPIVRVTEQPGYYWTGPQTAEA
jgi:glycosyltransferase involved in cell wall biosynthesis